MGIEDRVERVLRKIKLNKFNPFPFARTGFWQTVYGHYMPILKPEKPNIFHHVLLPDGDILVVAENRPKHWHAGQRIMLLVHGLTGDHESTYMQRMCRPMVKKGYLVLRLNLRHSGPGRGLAKQTYHAGASHDTRHVLEWIQRQFPNSPVTQIGFSLGANVSLKMAGEDGSRPSGNLDSVVAVSPPVDLKASVERMAQPENKMFERFFVKYLMKDAKLLAKLFPDHVGELEFPENPSIKTIEALFATHRAGFKSADDYHKKCSSIYYIPEIKVPTLILSSTDDPVVDGRALAQVEHSDNVDIILTDKGGHCGFLGWGTSYDEVRWADQAVARWLEDTITT